jgi:predicted nucleotidyltransferase
MLLRRIIHTCMMRRRGLPFAWNAKTIRSGLNFTLTTELGDLDLFGELAGGDTYSDLLPHSFEVEAFGVRFKCIDLPTLIRIKEAAGRSKDREAVAELRVLLEESEKKQV